MFLRYVSMLDYGPVSLLKTINVSYPIWLMQTSVCCSSIADHSCLILFLYTSSVILIYNRDLNNRSDFRSVTKLGNDLSRGLLSTLALDTPTQK